MLKQKIQITFQTLSNKRDIACIRESFSFEIKMKIFCTEYVLQEKVNLIDPIPNLFQ